MARLRTAEAHERSRATELRTLVDAAVPLNSLDTNLVLRTAVGTLLRLGHEAAAIALIDHRTGQLRVTHADGEIPDGAAEAVAAGDRGVTGRALQLDATVVEADYPSAPDAIPAVVAAGFRTMIATPVRADDAVIGVLLCASKRPISPIATDPETVEFLAAHAGRALRNADDYARQEINAAYHATQAAVDPLTGIGNRRHAETILAGLQPGDTVLVLDLDHFKNINDTYGHAAGDEVLRGFARFLRSSIRYGDGVARLGGEEFLVIWRASGPSLDGGGLDGEPRLVEAWRDTRPSTTVSAGLAVHRGDRTPAATLAAADSALYAAKEQGRDRAMAAAE
jgi:GGDEF domain-containing protein